MSPLAEGFAAIGIENFDLAFRRLEETIDHNTTFINMLGIDPFFNPIRSDRFTKLLKTLNLPH